MNSNNNPLNIRRVKGQKWKGEETPAYSLCKGSSKRPTKSTPGEQPLISNVASPLGEVGRGAFVRFESMEWGLRAAFCILRSYRNKHGLCCIRDIIGRWAPPTENDTERYIRNVCLWTGLSDTQRLTEHDWPALVRAMARQECGMLLTEEIINKGFELYKKNV